MLLRQSKRTETGNETPEFAGFPNIYEMAQGLHKQICKHLSNSRNSERARGVNFKYCSNVPWLIQVLQIRHSFLSFSPYLCDFMNNVFSYSYSQKNPVLITYFISYCQNKGRIQSGMCTVNTTI